MQMSFSPMARLSHEWNRQTTEMGNSGFMARHKFEGSIEFQRKHLRLPPRNSIKEEGDGIEQPPSPHVCDTGAHAQNIYMFAQHGIGHSILIGYYPETKSLFDLYVI